MVFEESKAFCELECKMEILKLHSSEVSSICQGSNQSNSGQESPEHLKYVLPKNVRGAVCRSLVHVPVLVDRFLFTSVNVYVILHRT